MRVLALRALVDLDARLRGERPQRVREGHAVALHHEAEHVAAQPAAEALPRIPARGDRERRRLLTVEGAQALERGARLLQLHRLADHVDDVQPALDFRRYAASQPTSGASARASLCTPPMPGRFWWRLAFAARRRTWRWPVKT